ncbi:MAG: histidine kinase [Alphaproteobacteria bacterium]|jgi:hypothetical protein|nr:histidine kinase [Alphaproteobacteria bacterium]MDP7426687.1 histidine kinase [Alphaproteobacteria bacterium]
MTKFLLSAENPRGWKLEDLLVEIQNDVIKRMSKILDDQRPEARSVVNNSLQIASHIAECIALANDSARILNSLGPAGNRGQPRIGGG